MSVSTAILVDTFHHHRRMVASSTSTVAIFIGSSVGPVIGGKITEKFGMKWIFLVPAIACGVMGILGAVFLRETYAPLLRRKMNRKQMLDDEERHQRLCDVDSHQIQFKHVMKHALIRPFKLPFVHFMCSVLLLYVGL